MAVPTFQMPERVLDAFDQMDRLNRLAQTCLDENEREIWRLMQPIETTDEDGEEIQTTLTADEISVEMNCTVQWVRRLRVRVQNKLNQAALEEKEGVFRVAVTVQHGSNAEFQEDTTARSAIESASRSRKSGELREAA